MEMIISIMIFKQLIPGSAVNSFRSIGRVLNPEWRILEIQIRIFPSNEKHCDIGVPLHNVYGLKL